jgi:hypothetical protein
MAGQFYGDSLAFGRLMYLWRLFEVPLMEGVSAGASLEFGQNRESKKGETTLYGNTNWNGGMLHGAAHFSSKRHAMLKAVINVRVCKEAGI